MTAYISETIPHYIDNFDDSPVEYCSCDTARCTESSVIGGITIVIRPNVPHQYFLGRWLFCDNDHCDTCLQALPF